MKFKIGDKVIHNVYGTGVVKNIANRCSMPYEVEFDYKKRWCEECNLLSSTLTTGQMIDAIRPGTAYERDNADGGECKQVILSNGVLKWKENNCNVSIRETFLSAKWTLVSESKPVTLMEAVKVYEEESKVIEVKYAGLVHTYNPNDSRVGMCDENGDAIGTDEILYGQWYIKED